MDMRNTPKCLCQVFRSVEGKNVINLLMISIVTYTVNYTKQDRKGEEI